MPSVNLTGPMGERYAIHTTNPELLRAWLDEWLPRLHGGDRYIPTIWLWPLFTSTDGLHDPDWITDSRVLGDRYPVDAKTGADGMAFIGQLRAKLDAKIEALNE